MGYWNYELFDNDSTMDWVDDTSEKLVKHMLNDHAEPSNFYNAAIWFRGIMAVVADTKRSEVPLSAIRVAYIFYKNVDYCIALCEHEDFRNVLLREERNIEWFLASDMGLSSLESIGGVSVLKDGV